MAEKNDNQLRFPGMEKAHRILDSVDPDEPIFVLRAKDVLSILTLKHYQGLIESYAPHEAQSEAMNQTLRAFREWQSQNPTKVRLPD